MKLRIQKKYFRDDKYAASYNLQIRKLFRWVDYIEIEGNYKVNKSFNTYEEAFQHINDNFHYWCIYINGNEYELYQINYNF